MYTDESEMKSMSDERKQARDLLLYTQLKNSAGNNAALLAELFSSPVYSMIQALIVLDAKESFKLFSYFVSGQTVRLRIGSNRDLFLINAAEDQTEEIILLLRRNAAFFNKASLSRCYPLPVPMQKVIAEAENNLLDAFVYPNEAIFPYRAPQYTLIEQRESLITDLVKQNQYQQIHKIVLDTPGFFAQYGLSARDAIYLWNRIGIHTANQPGFPPLEHLNLYELMERFKTIREMSQYLSCVYWENRTTKRNMAAAQFALLVDYIDHHYSEKMELGQLCDQFFISPSYASALFQKEKQMGFSQYLTHTRIQSACNLMRTHPQLTIAEIGEMVGYKDYFYFAKVFRKQMGCTPSSYKSGVKMDNGTKG